MKHRAWFEGLLCFTLLSIMSPICASAFGATEPQVIPQPRELETGQESFRLSVTTRIVISLVDREDRFAAQVLAQERKELAGLQTPVTTGTLDARSSRILLGRFTDPPVQAVLRSHRLTIESVGDVCPGRYSTTGPIPL